MKASASYFATAPELVGIGELWLNEDEKKDVLEIVLEMFESEGIVENLNVSWRVSSFERGLGVGCEV